MPEAENPLTTTYWGNLSKVHTPICFIAAVKYDGFEKSKKPFRHFKGVFCMDWNPKVSFRKFLFISLIIVCLIAWVTSAPSFAATFKGSYPMKVGTTVGRVADIVREVAGDKAEVKNIIGSGVDPHDYNPTRSDVAVLLKSDIIFYSGLLLEGQMSDVLAKVSHRRPVYAVTELLQADYLIHDAKTNHHDLHVWMDVQGWMRAVDVVADALTAFDPPNKETYIKNAQQFGINSGILMIMPDKRWPLSRTNRDSWSPPTMRSTTWVGPMASRFWESKGYPPNRKPA
jgi:hypothetical protein